MSNRQGAQERSRDKTACGGRASARPLTAPSTVAAHTKVRAIQQRSGEFYSGTSEEFSTGIDMLIPESPIAWTSSSTRRVDTPPIQAS